MTMHYVKGSSQVLGKKSDYGFYQKKGNLTELKNWRPIALINCDAKIFARLLTRRLAPLTAKLINPFQKGFIKGRFIGENGMYVHLILQ